MKKTKYLGLFLLAVIFAALILTSCGDDTTTNNNNQGGGTPPTINMTVGAVYTLNVDSIRTNGQVIGTILKTTQTYLSQGTFFGQNAFQVRSVTRDSLNAGPQLIDTLYVRYDGGKFYQYGVLQLLDPNIPATWDMVADFTVTQGNEWTIASSVPISFIPGATATIKGKVAADTTFTTEGWGNRSVHAYRIQISAEIFLVVSLGTIYVDYFIGDANPSTNPSGLVRLRLNPINITGFTAAGLDQKMQKWTP